MGGEVSKWLFGFYLPSGLNHNFFTGIWITLRITGYNFFYGFYVPHKILAYSNLTYLDKEKY